MINIYLPSDYYWLCISQSNETHTAIESMVRLMDDKYLQSIVFNIDNMTLSMTFDAFEHHTKNSMINKMNNNHCISISGRSLVGEWQLPILELGTCYARRSRFISCEIGKKVHFVRIQKKVVGFFFSFGGTRENKRPKKEQKSKLSKVFYVHNARTAWASIDFEFQFGIWQTVCDLTFRIICVKQCVCVEHDANEHIFLFSSFLLCASPFKHSLFENLNLNNLNGFFLFWVISSHLTHDLSEMELNC